MVLRAGWGLLFEGSTGRFASCFPRRESRLHFREKAASLPPTLNIDYG